jgi:hypothetical protein
MELGAGILLPPAASVEIEGLVETLSRELDEIAATLTDTIHEHLLELEDDLRPWTLQAARSNLGVIVTMMREGDDPASAVPPAEAIGYARASSPESSSSGCARRPTMPTSWPKPWLSSTPGFSPGSRRSSGG